jgi:predicted AAA+ superfamily ATPase
MANITAGFSLSRSWIVEIENRLQEDKSHIQILLGPRQIGKTTSLLALQQKLGPTRCVYSTADDKQTLGSVWIEQEWERTLKLSKSNNQIQNVVLILDEIQKISNWSETVKKLWDQNAKDHSKMKVILSGSSSLAIQSGLSESLAGRFELIPAVHATFAEFQSLSNLGIDHFIYYGAYPGSLELLNDPTRWKSYILSSLIETVLSRDILSLARVHKPALLKRLFQLGCAYSGQILSYQKAMGQLQDAGNTTTLAHYLELLDYAFLIKGLTKYEGGKKISSRSSSPKFLPYSTALSSALNDLSFEELKDSSDLWGRQVESAVGAYLVNESRKQSLLVQYWREGNDEVDFVLSQGAKAVAIEVKSGRSGKFHKGLAAFKQKFPKAKTIVVGDSGFKLEDFFKSPLSDFF